MDQNGVIGFFDGAQQNRICGAGMVIRIRNNSSYKLKLGAGCGTNTKVELVTL